MIHYHGSPMSGKRLDVIEFYRGRHALAPFPRPDDLPAIAEVCQSFVLDNGAFSIWKQGGTLDYKGYLDFVEQWRKHPAFDWAIIPDVIGGTEAENDRFLDMWETKAKGVPVWHLDESIERLKRLADRYEIVALGSSGVWRSPGSLIWWERIKKVLDAICDSGGAPPCKLHGLRMLDREIFTKLPLHSADSTNAARNSNQIWRFGSTCPPTAGQRAKNIADQIESEQSAPVWISSQQQELFKLQYENE